MGNNQLDAKKLLELSIGLGFVTLLTTYIVSTTSGRVAPFIPIISEMPFAEPESSLFSGGLTVSLFCFVLLTQTFHRIFEPLAKEAGGNYESWNDMIRILATFGGACGIVTVNFHWNIHPVLHGVTAGVVFTSFLIWGTFATHLLEKTGRGHDVRKLAVYAGWSFYVLMIVFSGLDSKELVDDGKSFFYRLDNPPTVEQERSNYLNLTAFCEWAMVFSFYVGALTYRKELEGISI